MTASPRPQRAAAVVHDHFSMPGGGERTALALRTTLDADLWTGFVHGAPARALLGRELDHLRTVAPRLPVPLVRTLLLSYRMPRVPLADYRLAVLSGNSAACSLLGQRPGRSVIYCHSPPRYLFDQRDLLRRRVPATLRPLANALLRDFEQRYRSAIDRSDLILANSETVRARVQRYLHRDAQVVHPPVDTAAFRWLAAGDYFVSSARIAPLKRVEAIVRAFLRLPQQPLVVLSGGPDERRLRALAAGAANIRFTGWVSDAERSELIGRCRATIYVPVDEDFGLSPVESMAAGKPVIGVQEGGLCETVQHARTGLLLPPDFRRDDLCDAVGAMNAQRSRDMRDACERRAGDFSEARFRQRFADVCLPASCRRPARSNALGGMPADRLAASAIVPGTLQ